MKKVFLVLLAFVCFGYAEDKAPFSVEVEQMIRYGEFADTRDLRLYVTALQDGVKLKDIVVNRGNCAEDGKRENLNIDMKYAQEFQMDIFGCRKILEVEITTEKNGGWTFSFK